MVASYACNDCYWPLQKYTFTCYCHSQIFERYHNFQISICYLCITAVSCNVSDRALRAISKSQTFIRLTDQWQDHMNTVMKLTVPQKLAECTITFSRKTFLNRVGYLMSKPLRPPCTKFLTFFPHPVQMYFLITFQETSSGIYNMYLKLPYKHKSPYLPTDHHCKCFNSFLWPCVITWRHIIQRAMQSHGRCMSKSWWNAAKPIWQEYTHSSLFQHNLNTFITFFL
jgi:hypothetical protein